MLLLMVLPQLLVLLLLLPSMSLVAYDHFPPSPCTAGDDGKTEEVNLPDVKATVLSKIIEFMRHHVENRLPEIEKVRVVQSGNLKVTLSLTLRGSEHSFVFPGPFAASQI